MAADPDPGWGRHSRRHQPSWSPNYPGSLWPGGGRDDIERKTERRGFVCRKCQRVWFYLTVGECICRTPLDARD
jgi:hypothetical protein